MIVRYGRDCRSAMHSLTTRTLTKGDEPCGVRPMPVCLGLPARTWAEEDDVSGVSPEDLAETDLIRELEHLHRTRHDTFLHGAPDALREHTRRSAELEGEYLRRHPERDVDPARTRAGARGSDGSFPT
jgi:hypothetical protein